MEETREEIAPRRPALLADLEQPFTFLKDVKMSVNGDGKIVLVKTYDTFP